MYAGQIRATGGAAAIAVAVAGRACEEGIELPCESSFTLYYSTATPHLPQHSTSESSLYIVQLYCSPRASIVVGTSNVFDDYRLS